MEASNDGIIMAEEENSRESNHPHSRTTRGSETSSTSRTGNTLDLSDLPEAAPIPYPEFGSPGCTCPDGEDGIDQHYFDCPTLSPGQARRHYLHSFTMRVYVADTEALGCAHEGCTAVLWPWERPSLAKRCEVRNK